MAGTSLIGKAYPAFEYEVGKEKIAEYARAIGEQERVYFDRGAARDAGFRDVVAPPMFAVVYSAGALIHALFDHELGVDFARLVHGAQEFDWDEPVCCGDVISTVASVDDIAEKAGNGFFTLGSVSTNQEGAGVVRGTWTHIVRGT